MKSKLKQYKDLVITFLKETVYKVLIKKVLGSAVGGVKGFLFGLAFKYIWKYVEPVLRTAWRKVEMVWHKYKNNKKISKVKKADNEEDFNSAFDDLP